MIPFPALLVALVAGAALPAYSQCPVSIRVAPVEGRAHTDSALLAALAEHRGIRILPPVTQAALKRGSLEGAALYVAITLREEPKLKLIARALETELGRTVAVDSTSSSVRALPDSARAMGARLATIVAAFRKCS